MFEIARNLERTAAGFSPTVAVTIGLVAVTVGLFVWLGGLGFRKLLVAIVGAVAGGFCGFFVAHRNLPSAISSAAVAVVLALIFEHIFIIVLTAALAAVSSFVLLAALFNVDFGGNLKQAFLQMPAYTWPIIAALVVIFILAGSYLWRLTSALCCAILGTVLVFVGMILLLLHKGAAPVTYISSRTVFFAAVFVAMTAFGTVEQLLFCQPAIPQPGKTKQKTVADEEPDATGQSWRNR